MTYERIKQFIEDNKIELPSIKGKSFDMLVFDIIKNKATFEQLLCLIAVITRGRYITLVDNILEESIRSKREQKFFFLNIILDLLYVLKMIEYDTINEEIILVKITNEELYEALNQVRNDWKHQPHTDAGQLIKEIDEAMEGCEAYKKYRKEIEDDYPTTPRTD